MAGPDSDELTEVDGYGLVVPLTSPSACQARSRALEAIRVSAEQEHQHKHSGSRTISGSIGPQAQPTGPHQPTEVKYLSSTEVRYRRILPWNKQTS